MPRPKDVRKYGTQYWTVANILQKKGGGNYTLELPDHKTAMNLRWDFYAFVRALKLELKALGKEAPDPMKETLATLRAYRMCVNGNKLTFEHASDSPMAQILDSAIEKSDKRSLREQFGLEETPPPPLPVQQMDDPAPDLSAGMYDDIFKDDEK